MSPRASSRCAACASSAFQEGTDGRVEEVFRRVASVTGGAYCRFDPRAAAELRQLLAAVAAYAAGGQVALAARKDGGARLLLAAIGGAR